MSKKEARLQKKQKQKENKLYPPSEMQRAIDHQKQYNKFWVMEIN